METRHGDSRTGAPAGKPESISGNTIAEWRRWRQRLRDPSVSVDPDVFARYKDVPLIDVHNHDAIDKRYEVSIPIWDQYGVDKVVLFGTMSCPEAVATDEHTWDAYRKHSDRFIPFFAGFDLKDRGCLDVVAKNLERGFFGIGEFVAASTRSPVCSTMPWKGSHPLDGFFPQVYELCAKYDAPLLLHIDPANGAESDMLEQACAQHPATTFIRAHVNAYNAPDNLRGPLKRNANLYMDFFAGFSAFNPKRPCELEDFVGVIEEFPDRFFVSSDSAYEMSYDEAYVAVYRLFSKLKPSTVECIAYKNFMKLIERQPSTTSQREKIGELSRSVGTTIDASKLNKREANELLFRYGA